MSLSPVSSSKRFLPLRAWLVSIGLAVSLGVWPPGASPAVASTAYGDLNNFDVFNDTGRDCHGFEIELDDIHSTDITYTFDWNHYGTPTIQEDNSDPAHPKVFVRYLAKYNGGSFSAYTAVPPAPPSPTNGHMCTNPSVNIGCEHFGVGYYGNPSAVRYHWLVEDPAAPGSLVHGPAVQVATPNWTYYPPAPAQPVAQVQAVILPPPPPEVPAYEFGDAVWVKAIVTTSHNNNRVELKDLVSDDPDDLAEKNWKNGEPDEVEVEWQILQTEFSNPDGANNDLAGAPEELPDGDEVVTRRYEFYKYEGPFDPESHEAVCTKYPAIQDPADPKYKADCDPASVTIVGDYIGAQMAGFNVEAVLGTIDHLQDGEMDVPYTPRTVIVGGNTPYAATLTSGALPNGMSLDAATGVLSGTPASGGTFQFTIQATDADMVQVSKAYTLNVAGGVDLCAGVVCQALDTCHVAGACDPFTGLCSNPVAVDGTACDDGDGCSADTCQAGACVATACPSVDVVVSPAKPLRFSVGKGVSTVNKVAGLAVRNAGTVDRTVRLTVDDSACPAGMVTSLDLNPATVAAEDSVLVPAGKLVKAALALSLRSADFTSGSAKAPSRCTLRVQGAAVVAGGSNEATPLNNQIPLEIDVLDKNDPEQMVVHETTLRAMAPGRLSIGKGATADSKIFKVVVGNADLDTLAEGSGHEIAVSATTSCAGISVGQPVCDAMTLSDRTLVRGGASKSCQVEVLADGTAISTPSSRSPHRCIVSVVVTGPSSPEAAPLDASNNVTELVVDVTDKNDVTN